MNKGYYCVILIGWELDKLWLVDQSEPIFPFANRIWLFLPLIWWYPTYCAVNFNPNRKKLLKKSLVLIIFCNKIRLPKKTSYLVMAVIFYWISVQFSPLFTELDYIVQITLHTSHQLHTLKSFLYKGLNTILYKLWKTFKPNFQITPFYCAC